MTYSRITLEQFNAIQIDSGMWVRSFDINNPAIKDGDIICATTGGISLSIVPRLVDNGEGVYMMPKHTADMMQVTGWYVGASFTSLKISGKMIRFALGASDSAEDGIAPRNELQDDDFADIWWVGDRADGGLVAVHLLNALSDEGINLQTSRNNKGQMAVHLTAHASIDGDMYEPPVEIYSIENRPTFDVVAHKYLVVYDARNDEFQLDESTGHLYITANSGWTYTVNEESGKMEVSK